MTIQRSTREIGRRAARILPYLLLLMPLAMHGTLRGQTLLDTAGRLEALDPGLHPIPAGDEQGLSLLFFRDSLHGFVGGGGGSFASFGTTDGGITWKQLARPVPVPHSIHAAGFGIAPSGYVTTDGGGEWRHLRIDITDTALRGYGTITSAAAITPTTYVVTAEYEVASYDSSQQRNIYRSTTRLLVTTDGGATYRAADSIVMGGGADEFQPWVKRATLFGALPVPDSVPSARVGWARVLDVDDAGVCSVISFATWAGPSTEWKLRTQFYLGTMNVATMSVAWRPLPLWGDIDPVTNEIEGYNLTRVSPGLMSAYSPPYTRQNQRYDLMRSTDGGVTWGKISTPSWLAVRTARVFSANDIVAANGFTTDGGATWTPRGNAFLGPAVNTSLQWFAGFAAVSRSRQVLINGNLVGVSLDSGSTWSRNHAWRTPRTIAARDGFVVAGWTNRAITRSTDAGRSWIDAGTGGADMPERLMDIYTIDFVKAAPATDELFGIGRFAMDSGTYIGTIHSTDGGATWREGSRIPGLDPYDGSIYPQSLRVRFLPTDDGSRMRGLLSFLELRMASDDSGRSWSDRRPAQFNAFHYVSGDRAIGARAVGLMIQILTTADNGATWAERYSGVSQPPYSIDEAGPGRYRALGPDAELRSDDGGLTWTEGFRLDDAGRPHTGIVHRLDTSRLYLFDKRTWYYSPDAGRSLQKVRAKNDIYDADISVRDDRYIYLAGANNTLARWRLGEEPSSGVHAGVVAEADASLVENIVRGATARVRVNLDAAGGVSVAVADMLGREVWRGGEATLEAGAGMLDIDVSALASGRYLVIVRAGGRNRALPLVVAR
jgi:hypothetical protein